MSVSADDPEGEVGCLGEVSNENPLPFVVKIDGDSRYQKVGRLVKGRF